MSESYTVLWVIDLDADDPLDAARLPLRTQRDPQSTALVFHVLRSEHTPDLDRFTEAVVDLAEHPTAAALGAARHRHTTHLADLIAAADGVVAAWERGSLAAAVNMLRETADAARNSLTVQVPDRKEA